MRKKIIWWLILVLLIAFNLRNAFAAPLQLNWTPEGEYALTQNEAEQTTRMCLKVWNKTFRSGGRFHLKRIVTLRIPKRWQWTQEWWQEIFLQTQDLMVSYGMLDKKKVYLFVYPPLCIKGWPYFAGLAHLDTYYTDLLGLLPTYVTTHIGKIYQGRADLITSAKVICHELGHARYRCGVTKEGKHPKRSVMASPPGKFYFRKVCVVRANRRIRKAKKEKLYGKRN